MTEHIKNTPTNEDASEPRQVVSRGRNRRTLVGLLIIFAAPVLLAYVGWWQGWFLGIHTTNRGQFLSPPLHWTQFAAYVELPKPEGPLSRHVWWLIYITDDSSCSHACQANVYTLNQVRTAMGKDMQRIDKLVLSLGQPLTSRATQQVHDHFGAPVLGTLQRLHGRFTKERGAAVLRVNSLYLMDPAGNMILRYDAVVNEKNAPQRGKDIIKDLKKLLKYSQIG